MLRATIFEKSLHLSPKERVVYPPEKIINMSGIDVEAVGMYVWKIHEIWSAPLQIVVIAVLVVSIMGASGLCGKIASSIAYLFSSVRLILTLKRIFSNARGLRVGPGMGKQGHTAHLCFLHYLERSSPWCSTRPALQSQKHQSAGV
jgi:hypothetical protein